MLLCGDESDEQIRRRKWKLVQVWWQGARALLVYINMYMLSRLTKSKVRLGCYIQTQFGGCFINEWGWAKPEWWELCTELWEAKTSFLLGAGGSTVLGRREYCPDCQSVGTHTKGGEALGKLWEAPWRVLHSWFTCTSGVLGGVEEYFARY